VKGGGGSGRECMRSTGGGRKKNRRISDWESESEHDLPGRVDSYARSSISLRRCPSGYPVERPGIATALAPSTTQAIRKPGTVTKGVAPEQPEKSGGSVKAVLRLTGGTNPANCIAVGKNDRERRGGKAHGQEKGAEVGDVTGMADGLPTNSKDVSTGAPLKRR